MWQHRTVYPTGPARVACGRQKHSLPPSAVPVCCIGTVTDPPAVAGVDPAEHRCTATSSGRRPQVHGRGQRELGAQQRRVRKAVAVDIGDLDLRPGLLARVR